MKITNDQIKRAMDEQKIDLTDAKKILKTKIDPSGMGVSSSLLAHHPLVRESMKKLIDRDTGLQNAFMIAFTMMSKLGPDQVVLCTSTENVGNSIVHKYWYEVLDE